jgi:NAD(P)-dependent dehydrogenase (short-subunit alcohol dehydrogenase family)
VALWERKTAVVTGGTSGLGFATAKLLLAHGARVLITGRTAATLDRARERLGGHAIAVKSDTASLTEIDTLADRVKSEFGTLGFLFVNAGMTQSVPFEAMTEALYDEMLAVNSKGPYFTVQKLAPLMTTGSAVVLTTSVSDAKGQPMVSAYAASKAALRSMTRTLARELLPRGIRVNAVSPGPIDTGILERSMSAEGARQARVQMTENNPMKRFGHPEEVAKAAMFLAAEATFTTGAELPVDGGVSQL